MEWITSKENRWIKAYRKLSTQRRARKEAGLFAAEGARLCEEAARCGLEIPQVLVTASALERYQSRLAPVLAAAGTVLGVSEDLAAALGDTKTPQGVFAICRTPDEIPPDLRPGGRYLLLENMQDPGNLGAVIRTADAFGADALLLSPDAADCYAPRVLRGAMGSVFRLPIHRGPLDGFIDRLHAMDLPVYAATLDKSSVPAWELPRGGGAVAVGNEGAGLSPQTVARCGRTVHIPMAGRTESLGAAVASSILLWELCGKSRGEGQGNG